MVRSLLFFICFSIVNNIFAQSGGDVYVYKGNQSFKDKNFDDASYQYLKAIEKNSSDFKAQYNLGNTLYKKNQYSDAISAYQKALKSAKNQQEKKSALYNLGNAQFKNNQKKQAVESYKQALKLDPENQRILKNLRIAQQKAEPQKQPQQSENQQQGEKESPMDMYSPEKNNEKKEEQNTENHEHKENNQESDDEKKLEQELLKYIDEKERNTAKRALNKKGYSQPQSNQKDW